MDRTLLPKGVVSVVIRFLESIATAEKKKLLLIFSGRSF